MPDTLENIDLRLANVEQWQADLTSKSKEPEDLPVTANITDDYRVVVQAPNGSVTYATKAQLVGLITSDWVNISASGDKTDKWCYGQKNGINGDDIFIGWRSKVADPTSDTDFYEPYGYSG